VHFLQGTAGWLEILLFTTGVVCVALEIFAIPGLGAFGIGGGALIFASIVLATQTYVIPRTTYEWNQLPSSLFMVVAAAAGALTPLIFMRRLVTEAPVFRRVALEKPDEQSLDTIRQHESLVHLEFLAGKRGVTTTQLTPSGKARFGDEVVDVMTSGEVIPRGADVYVVKVSGNEVIVRPIG
jgi:membrane-bound ClpP family serine protease